MKVWCALLGLVCSLSLQAQITITANNMPQPGQIDTMVQAAPIVNFDPADGQGPNQTWDYSNLNDFNTEADTFFDVLETPLSYNFAFNLPFDEDRATVAGGYALLPDFGDFPLPIDIEFTDEYSYYRNGEGNFRYVGFAFRANGVPIPVKYDSPDIWYTLPMTYQTPQEPSVSRYEFTIPTLANYISNRSRTNVVDGWGTLKLPNKEVEALRIVSTSVVRDSLFLDTLGFWLNPPPRTEVEVKFWALGYNQPVLTISGQEVPFPVNSFQVNEVRYRYFAPLGTSVKSPNETKTIQVYPTITNTAVNITSANMATYRLCNTMGQVVSSGTITTDNFRLPVNTISTGIYYLYLNTQTTTLCKKLLVY